MIRFSCFLAACVLICVASLGCGSKGPELGSVTGKVTLDGKPVTNGLVTFKPVAGGREATGRTDANGQYELLYIDRKGALLGQHNVTVITLKEAAPVVAMSSDSPEYAKQAAGGQADYNNAKVVEPIPARYNANSELTKEVTAGDNVIDLELKSTP